MNVSVAEFTQSHALFLIKEAFNGRGSGSNPVQVKILFSLQKSIYDEKCYPCLKII